MAKKQNLGASWHACHQLLLIPLLRARATEAIAVCIFAKTHVVEAHVVAVVAERRPTTTSMTDVIRSMLDVEQRQASMLSYDVCICLLLHLLLFLLLLLAPRFSPRTRQQPPAAPLQREAPRTTGGAASGAVAALCASRRSQDNF